jgi:phosphoacetylglucosamine mutase
VKYLHPCAAAYDVGLYFEANGHGTVLFKPAFLARLNALDESSLNVEVCEWSDV